MKKLAKLFEEAKASSLVSGKIVIGDVEDKETWVRAAKRLITSLGKGGSGDAEGLHEQGNPKKHSKKDEPEKTDTGSKDAIDINAPETTPLSTKSGAKPGEEQPTAPQGGSAEEEQPSSPPSGSEDEPVSLEPRSEEGGEEGSGKDVSSLMGHADKVFPKSEKVFDTTTPEWTQFSPPLPQFKNAEYIWDLAYKQAEGGKVTACISIFKVGGWPEKWGKVAKGPASESGAKMEFVMQIPLVFRDMTSMETNLKHARWDFTKFIDFVSGQLS